MSAATCAPRRSRRRARSAKRARSAPAELKAVEDREIEKLIKKQEEVGLQCATDGEYRRSWWHFDFYGMLDGVEIYELDHGIQFQGVQTKPRSIRVKGKIGFSSTHPMLEHFKFLKAHTKVMPKMCIPSPTVLHFRLEPGAVDRQSVYPDRDAIFDDLGEDLPPGGEGVLRRRLPLPAVRRHRLGLSVLRRRDEEGQGPRHERRDAGRRLHPRHQRLVKDKPADMVITTHVCRGNFRSTWISSGGYEPVAERMLARVQLRRLFPGIRHRPRRRLRAAAVPAQGQQDRGGRRSITSKSGTLEKQGRTSSAGIDEAAKFAPLEQLALVAAMRLCLDRGGQRADRGAAMGQDARGGRDRRRGVGEVVATAVVVAGPRRRRVTRRSTHRDDGMPA